MALQTLGSVADACDWLRARGARALVIDSRQVTEGSAFIAWPGHAQDGRAYVPAALRAGAVACLVEADQAERFDYASDAPVAALSGLKAATGLIAACFAGHPSLRLSVIATTGTNGKTSTAWWTAQALTRLGRRCGMVGTLGVGVPPSSTAASDDVSDDAHGQLMPTGLTTPDPVTLQTSLRRMVDDGLEAVAIEASSIGIVEHRLAGVEIRVALYTNFTQDHLDYHGSMDAYWQAKAQLFQWPGLQSAVVNIDNPRGMQLVETLRGAPIALWTTSSRSTARLRADDIGYSEAGLRFVLQEADQVLRVQTRLIGEHNVENLLAVIGGLRALGIPLERAAEVCAQLTPVPGRMQRVLTEGQVDGQADGHPEVVVDYAHTPDALEKVLLALQPLARSRRGRLWCVFGCGGNRDAGKRPLMGAVAQRLAQRVVLTSDNPRQERPSDILAQIHQGMTPSPAVDIIEDRRTAIRHAVANASANDVVLIAGKGHETHQEIAGKKLPFSDIEEAGLALRQKGAWS